MKFSNYYSIVRKLMPLAMQDMVELRCFGSSALKGLGWDKSRSTRMPIDAAGRPLPWYTYPAIRFLEGRIPQDAFVFEYGAGNSTIWWSNQVRRVASCEHDPDWAGHLRPILPPNSKLILNNVKSDEYVNAASKADELIDVLVIDGRRRVDCTSASLVNLCENGIIIFDNSERDEYHDAYRTLERHNFNRIDLWGMGPINTTEWCTSIFYRTNNCLAI